MLRWCSMIHMSNTIINLSNLMSIADNFFHGLPLTKDWLHVVWKPWLLLHPSEAMRDSALEGFVVRQATPSYALHVEQVEGCMAMGEQKYTSQAPFTNAAWTTTAYEAIGVSLTASDVAALRCFPDFYPTSMLWARHRRYGSHACSGSLSSLVCVVVVDATICSKSGTQSRKNGEDGEVGFGFHLLRQVRFDVRTKERLFYLFPCFLFLSYSEF